jgi:hypothetical protein
VTTLRELGNSIASASREAGNVIQQLGASILDADLSIVVAVISYIALAGLAIYVVVRLLEIPWIRSAVDWLSAAFWYLCAYALLAFVTTVLLLLASIAVFGPSGAYVAAPVCVVIVGLMIMLNVRGRRVRLKKT